MRDVSVTVTRAHFDARPKHFPGCHESGEWVLSSLRVYSCSSKNALPPALLYGTLRKRLGS